MKMFKKFLTMGLAMTLALSLFAACGNKADTEQTKAPETNAQTENKEDTASSEPRHLNAASHMVGTSLDAGKSYQGWTLTRAGIGETLVKLDDDVNLVPCIADSWEWVDDCTLKLHIRDGVTFHSGKAVDAEAVKLAFEHAAEENTRFPNYIDLKEFIADGQYLTIVSNSKNPQMLWNLTEPLFCVMDVTVDDIDMAPAGTGPYKVDSFVEDRIEMSAYENYWNGEVGLDTITFTKISDAEARVMALQSGEVDMTVTIDHTNIKLFENDDYNVSVISGVRTNVVKMNCERPFLKYQELRQAICYAVDRETIGQNITGGAASVCLFPTSTSGAVADVASIKGYTYDVAKANEILDNAGFVDSNGDGIREIDGQNIHLEYYQAAAHGSAEAGLIAQAVQTYLGAIGVEVQIMSAENLSDVKTSGQFDFMSDNSNTVPTGDGQYFLTNMYYSKSGSNWSNYSNAEVDKMIESYSDLYTAEERSALTHQIAQLLVDDAADIYVTTVPMSTVSRAYVKNAEQPTVDYYMINQYTTIEK